MAFPLPGNLAALAGGGQVAPESTVGETMNEAGIFSSPYAVPAMIAASMILPKVTSMFGGGPPKWTTEIERLKKAHDKGVNIPAELGVTLPRDKGRSKEELLAIESDKKSKGYYSNEKFAQSRNEADLNPEDIWGYAAFFDKFGNDWLQKFTEQQRRDIAKAALEAGAVDEHHGTIDIDWEKIPDLDKLISGEIKTNTPSLEPANKPSTPYLPAGQTAQPTPEQASSAPAGTDQYKAYVAQLNAASRQAAAQQAANNKRSMQLSKVERINNIANSMLNQNLATRQSIGKQAFAGYANPQKQYESQLNNILGGL